MHTVFPAEYKLLLCKIHGFLIFVAAEHISQIYGAFRYKRSFKLEILMLIFWKSLIYRNDEFKIGFLKHIRTLFTAHTYDQIRAIKKHTSNYR